MYESKLKMVFIGIEGSFYVSDKERFPEYYREDQDCFLHEIGHAMDDILGKRTIGHNISELKEIPFFMKSEPFPDKPDRKIKGYFNSNML